MSPAATLHQQQQQQPVAPAAAAARLREALPNARDLNEAFPAIPPGRLIRCANPSLTSPEDTEFLLGEMRVRDLIDLRAGEEILEDDAGSALMGRTAMRLYARGWLAPGKLFMRPDPLQSVSAGPRPPSAASAPSASTSSTAAAPSAAASSASPPPAHAAAPSPLAALDAPSGIDDTPTATTTPPSHLSSHSPSTSPTTTTTAASPTPSATTAIRHHISLLDRGRYYLALASRIPAATTAAALLTNFVSKPAARAMLLPYVNGGGLALLYEMLLESSRPEMCQVMEVLLRAAESRHCAMFFCRAGKDRTGLVAAAVLSVVGASDEEIIADYTRSDAFHRVALAGLEKREELAGLDRAAFERAPREVMEATLAYVKKRYGSFANYLTSVGFGPDKQARLRELLTAEW